MNELTEIEYKRKAHDAWKYFRAIIPYPDRGLINYDDFETFESLSNTVFKRGSKKVDVILLFLIFAITNRTKLKSKFDTKKVLNNNLFRLLDNSEKRNSYTELLNEIDANYLEKTRLNNTILTSKNKKSNVVKTWTAVIISHLILIGMIQFTDFKIETFAISLFLTSLFLIPFVVIAINWFGKDDEDLPFKVWMCWAFFNLFAFLVGG